MKFREIKEKQTFTWWETERFLTGVKISKGQAFCTTTNEVVNIHGNKNVSIVENSTEENPAVKFIRTARGKRTFYADQPDPNQPDPDRGSARPLTFDNLPDPNQPDPDRGRSMLSLTVDLSNPEHLKTLKKIAKDLREKAKIAKKENM